MTIHTRQFDSELQLHTKGTGTTLCTLLRITTAPGLTFGITTLDQDVEYDDGDGVVNYWAAVGMDQTAVENSADLNVDNSEATVILTGATPFSPEAIEAGALDYASYIMYRVNWQDLTTGRHIEMSSGTTGAVEVKDGIEGTIELRGLPQMLKQNIIELYSLTCRARFGGGSYGDTLFMCGFDATTLWQNHTVTGVGTEVDREFTADSAPAVSGPMGPLDFVPGLIEWLTGDNVETTTETDEVIGAEIKLRLGTTFDIQVGDTFKIRPDCDKSWDQCRNDYDNGLNFRGEPLIPVGDEGSAQTPGGTYPVFPGFGVVEPEIP